MAAVAGRDRGHDGVECIVVLGGGPPDADGALPKWVEARCELALQVYTTAQASRGEGGQPPNILCLSGGTAHVPNRLDATGRAIHESTASASWLAARGVDPAHIFKEWMSYDTIGNAYFTRLTLTDPRSWRQLLVITSEFHMPRSKGIFDHVFGLDAPSPPYELSYLAAPDAKLAPDAVQARVEREQRSLASWMGRTPQLATLAALHEWLFSEHGCYAVAKQGTAADAKAAKALYST